MKNSSASRETDGNGLPFPDDKTIAAWKAEAQRALPNPDDWGDFVAMLRDAADLDRKGHGNPNLPENLTGCERALSAVIGFLQRQPQIMKRGDIAPLMRLHAALVDIEAGKASPLFKPVRKPVGSPGKGVTHAHIQGIAARALAELTDGRVPIQEAAGRIARALKASRRDMQRITAETVINWRERIEQGPGPGAPADAIRSFLEPLPPELGDTALKRGNNLVRALKERGGTIG